MNVSILMAITLISANRPILALAQNENAPAGPGRSTRVQEQTRGVPEKLYGSYVLGPDDQIVVRVEDSEEMSDKPLRIEPDGVVRLPMIGRMVVHGMTIEELETAITARLRKYFNDPEVSITVIDFRSQPISIMGAVRNPGVHQLQGHKTLIEVLSLAGGLNDDAGHRLKITRHIEWGKIPLKNASTDVTTKFSIAEVNIRQMMEATNPEDNIPVRPNDVIWIPRAEMVYISGQVQRAGGYVLRERETLSILQALSLAGGLDRFASPQNARILRRTELTTDRTEIPVDLKKIMAGEATDTPLMAEDILFVPTSAPKRAFVRAAEAAVQIGTGFAIYRR